ncbi:Ovostatin -like protein 2 [Collichthys lucidus]|uniref:Ovostatin-like protein 2 n=1 Tax=Collichthys lucidus TaxID=240159 RepID=A0A4U5V188_COLLU|nr:Ovostatin -like protein 2 [Collichthys lucidus]
MSVGQAVAGPQYMVAIPAILEAGAETKFCASLLQPNETLVMTVTLMSQDENTTLLQKTSSEEFHTCVPFKVPLVQKEVVQKFEVDVRGDTFQSAEVRRVMIRVYKPMTFIQTDKPIYLPGQTGISHPQEKTISISYVVGKLSFIDTPKIYDQGSNVEGKVKAIFYNDTPIPDMPVYLFKGQRWSSHLLQNLTTDSNGVASFSFSTADLNGDIKLHVSNKPTLDYRTYRTPHYESGHHTLSLAQPPSPDVKPVSSLQVKKKDKPLPCDSDEDISIQYNVVGEAQGSVDVMYLVSGGRIV